MVAVVEKVKEEVEEEKTKREPDWKEVELYGIVGVFDDPDVQSEMTFGGYIKVVKEDGELRGELIDAYGPSEIRGYLKEDTITFKKEYTLKQHSSDIEYNLKRTANGHFKGKCLISVSILGVEIEAELSIFLLNKDAYNIMAGPPTPKEMIKKFYGIR